MSAENRRSAAGGSWTHRLKYTAVYAAFLVLLGGAALVAKAPEAASLPAQANVITCPEGAGSASLAHDPGDPGDPTKFVITASCQVQGAESGMVQVKGSGTLQPGECAGTRMVTKELTWPSGKKSTIEVTVVFAVTGNEIAANVASGRVVSGDYQGAVVTGSGRTVNGVGTKCLNSEDLGGSQGNGEGALAG